MILDNLVIGLGNPGKKYEGSLHNAGFDVLDLLLKEQCQSWHSANKMLFAELRSVKCNVLLVKPQTYMNLSGQVLVKLRKRYQFKPEQCIVLLDNLDLTPGRLRLKFGGGFSSHNGLRSLCDCGLQANFWRFFIGIGHPSSSEQVSHYVLCKPRKADSKPYTASLERAKWALTEILRGVQPQDLVAEINRKSLPSLPLNLPD